MILYDYPRSSCAYRVRIALNLKALSYQSQQINLLEGQQASSDYSALNPQGLVPSIVLSSGQVITQSLAICEYLDEIQPTPSLLPKDPIARAHVRAMVQLIACDIHPLNNLRVLHYLISELAQQEQSKLTWYRHWIAQGFTALEAQLERSQAARFCYGDSVSLADICLIPQYYNAQRFDCELAAYPRIKRVAAHCLGLPAFQRAHPDN